MLQCLAKQKYGGWISQPEAVAHIHFIEFMNVHPLAILKCLFECTIFPSISNTLLELMLQELLSLHSAAREALEHVFSTLKTSQSFRF